MNTDHLGADSLGYVLFLISWHIHLNQEYVYSLN